MVEYLQKQISDRFTKESVEQINNAVTQRLEQEKKYIKFNEWCKENGVVSPAVTFPAAFGEDGGLVGLAAKRDIGFNEAYLYVPINVVISA